MRVVPEGLHDFPRCGLSEPSSTTMISRSGSVWRRAERKAVPTNASSLYAVMTTLI